MQSQYIGIKQATKEGFIKCQIPGAADLSYPTSELRRGRVQGGGRISPTITTSCGVCKIMAEEPKMKKIPKEIWEQMKQENYEFEVEYATAEEKPEIDKYLHREFGVFKLTPRECGRLMGVRDQDIDKMFSVNSNSQCYKQFGNSIVVPVLMAIFSQLNIKGVTPWNDLTQEQRETLIERTTT